MTASHAMMFRSHAALRVLAAVALGAVLLGCPDKGLVLIVEPDELDFGRTLDQLTFTVRKNFTSRELPGFQVDSDGVQWADATPKAGTSCGPNDPFTITVTIDRTLLARGENEGVVVVSALGAVPVHVKLKATALLIIEKIAVLNRR